MISDNLKFDRRQVLKMGAVGLAGCILPGYVTASGKIPLPQDRTLSFYNTHTGENLSVRYCRQGRYCDRSLEKVDSILRDHRSGEIHPMDTELLDLLFRLSIKLETNAPFHIISGYRSPSTNALLRKKSAGVAKKSFHTYGKAIDIRLPGLRLDSLKKTAMRLCSGGVGFYPRSNFIHVDIGPVRYWQGS